MPANAHGARGRPGPAEPAPPVERRRERPPHAAAAASDRQRRAAVGNEPGRPPPRREKDGANRRAASFAADLPRCAREVGALARGAPRGLARIPRRRRAALHNFDGAIDSRGGQNFLARRSRGDSTLARRAESGPANLPACGGGRRDHGAAVRAGSRRVGARGSRLARAAAVRVSYVSPDRWFGRTDFQHSGGLRRRISPLSPKRGRFQRKARRESFGSEAFRPM
jgi:hypothetical protein